MPHVLLHYLSIHWEPQRQSSHPPRHTNMLCCLHPHFDGPGGLRQASSTASVLSRISRRNLGQVAQSDVTTAQQRMMPGCLHVEGKKKITISPFQLGNAAECLSAYNTFLFLQHKAEQRITGVEAQKYRKQELYMDWTALGFRLLKLNG